MKVTITQLGGHIGSYAGDCAMIKIECGFDVHVVVIDTGSSKIWDRRNAFRDWVLEAYPKRPDAKRWLVTTHFHADHYDWWRHDSIKWNDWFHGSKMEDTPETGTRVSRAQRLLTGTESSGYSFYLDAYAPDWSQGKPKDENDWSLAVAFYASNGIDGFSFLSFGDMTKDGEERLPMGSLFRADVVKYPHHGSEKNYLKYFTYGICKSILISGDSGSAANTVQKLIKDNPEAAIRVLARTREARQQFGNSWKNKCSLYNLSTADVKMGTDLVITWSSGLGLWDSKTTFNLS